jgi:acetyl/propionyl-CoA carboxylase alpha subunit
MKVVYRRGGGDPREVVVEETAPHEARVETGELSGSFTVVPLGPGRFRMSNGRSTWRVCVDREGARRFVTVEGFGEARLEREADGRRRAREAPEGSLASPMPGTVVKVLVAAGDDVEKGQDLLVVEAMKMEIKVSAPAAGTVRAVHAAEGDPCDAGQVLAEVEPAGDGA